MAEVQGQAEVQQPAGALNQSEAVAAISQMIERAEKEDSPARDEKGKFAKAEGSQEAQPETEAPKESEAKEEAGPSEEEPEITPEVRKFKLKYKGEEIEKDESEVIALAQQGHDYTQKSQALAKEREELGQRVKTETEAASKRYEQQLETYKQAVLRMADPEVMTADLNKMAEADPARALQLMLKRNQVHQTLNGITGEQQRIAQARETEAQTNKQKQVQEALEVIQRDIPDWGAEKYGKILKAATSNGFTQEEANAITDPKVVKLLDKVRQFDELVAAKPKTVDKRIAAVPKVQKPGAGERTGAKTDKVKDGMARLSKSGSRSDAQDYVLALLESERL